MHIRDLIWGGLLLLPQRRPRQRCCLLFCFGIGFGLSKARSAPAGSWLLLWQRAAACTYMRIYLITGGLAFMTPPFSFFLSGAANDIKLTAFIGLRRAQAFL
jgi:hypothetical protein